jgi:hypothetical protein
MVRQALIVAIGAFMLFSSALAARADVGITINGSSVAVYPAPIMQSGRVFVPLRSVFENLGASVVYSNGQINATGNNTEISLTIGSTQATVNGSPVTIDVAPFIVGASTYVPLRFVSQALGANVSWDDGDQIVEITTGSVASAPDSAPPPIPYYTPPPVPQANYIWMPGYWAWGIAGYYWVPGTWVVAPQYGLLWTPGYWSWQNGGYAWHQGYWASSVGFYGGVNYGAGYYGNGFVGGRWSNNVFRYNTAVLQRRTQRHVGAADRKRRCRRASTARSNDGGATAARASRGAGSRTIGEGQRWKTAGRCGAASVYAGSEARRVRAG